MPERRACHRQRSSSTMLASASRRPQALRLPFLFPYGTQLRGYAQQKTARVPNAAPMRTTTNPSPLTQSKNRNAPSVEGAAPSNPKPKPTFPSDQASLSAMDSRLRDGKDFEDMRLAEKARRMEESGQQLDMVRQMVASGVDPWSTKVSLMGEYST